METNTLIDAELEHLVRPLRRAKLIALSMLGLAAVVFLWARYAGRSDSASSLVGYIGAAAEAAMVGALADWFAVTALFRHPLGLKIPHTAIVPRRKDQIGVALGGFVQQNFLAPDALKERVLVARPADTLVRWLEREGSGDLVSEQVCRAAAEVVRIVDADEMGQHLEHAMVDALRAVSAGPLLGDLVTVMLGDGRRDQVVDSVLGVVVRVLDGNRLALRNGFAERSPWWVPGSIDDRVFEKLFTGIIDLLNEVRHAPGHELRAELDRNIESLVTRLRSDPLMASKLDDLREEVLHDPRVRQWLTSVWGDVRSAVIQQSVDPASRLRTGVSGFVRRATKTLQNDEPLARRVDEWVASLVKTLAVDHGHQAAKLISSTVQRWDARDTSRRIELQIGRDLQFIRINGTIVGALVGVLIHFVGELIVS